MDSLAKKIAPGTVRLERMLDAGPETVWPYLTDSDKRGKWLATGPMDVRAGGAFAFLFDHNTLSPESGTVPERYKDAIGHRSTGKVLAAEPPRMLHITWGDGSDVMFELEPVGNRTRLIITHRNLATRGDMVGVSGGWHTHTGVLVDVVAGRTPPNFWKSHAGADALYEKEMPAQVD